MRKVILPALLVLALTGIARAAGEKDYVAGLAAMDKGDYAGAVKALDKAVDAEGSNGQYLEARGVAKALAQDLDGALADLGNAVKNLDAKDWEAKGWIGVVNRMKGDFQHGFIPGLAPRTDRDYGVAMNDLGQNYGMSVTHGTYFDKTRHQNVQTNQPYTGDFSGVAKMYVQKHRGADMAGEGAGGDTGGAVLDHANELLRNHDFAGALGEVKPLVEANPRDEGVLLVYSGALLGTGDVLEARKIDTELLTYDGEQGYGFLGRGAAEMGAGDAAAALKDLQIAQKLIPQEGAVQQLVAVAKTLGAPEDPQAVVKELEARAGANGATREELDQLGMRLVKAMEAHRVRYDENYQTQRNALEAALKVDPKNADKMVALGRFLYEQSGVLTEAVGPRSVDVQYRPQTAEMKTQEVDQATQLADAGIAADPQNVSAMTLKAEILLAAKNFDDAEDLTRKALAIKPDDNNLLELLAKLLQVDASYKITAAGNLKQPKDFFETRFDEYPPVEYHWVIYPTPEELKQAAQYEREAQAFSDLAMQTIQAAVKAGGRTKLGYYFEGCTNRMINDLPAAEEDMKQALALDPNYQDALFQLAAIYTDEKKGDDAIRTRIQAMNLSQTTDGPWLVAAWYKIPHGDLKGGRAALEEAAAIDPADPRVWAYTAALDEAEGKRDAALVHWQMARAVADAVLTLRGHSIQAPTVQNAATANEMGWPAVIHMRLAEIELENGQASAAATEFTLAAAAVNAIDAGAENPACSLGMLPNPNLKAGVVPLAETIGSLKVKAEAGRDYATWAVGGTTANAQDAGNMYRRLMIDYPLTIDNMTSYQAIADLGMAELFIAHGQLGQARQRMQNAPAVPQDFWQEMRKVQAELQ